MPLTRFRSSALRNGRAAIMRAAITCPIPGTVVSSFSVAVLMSILPSCVFSFARLFTSPGLLAAANELDVRVTGIEREGSGDACDCGPIPFDGCPVVPHPPTCRRFASFSSCASFLRSSAEVEPPGAAAVVPWILARPFAINCSPRSPSFVRTNP